MKKLLFIGCLLLAGCMSKGLLQTVFLKETDRRFTNLKGETCKQSGFQVIKSEDEVHYDLHTFYSNCELEEIRQLEQFEVRDWLKPK